MDTNCTYNRFLEEVWRSVGRPLPYAQLLNRNQSFLVPVWIIPEPSVAVSLDEGNGGSGNEIAA